MDRFNLHWLVALAALAQLALLLGAIIIVRRRKDATARRRTLATVGWTAAALWMLGGLLWSPLGLQYPQATPAFLPQLITTWPAHEAALVLTGAGLGANARTPIGVTALCAGIWALILWSPLLTLPLRPLTIRAALAIQAAAFLVVTITFFSYGNG